MADADDARPKEMPVGSAEAGRDDAEPRGQRLPSARMLLVMADSTGRVRHLSRFAATLLGHAVAEVEGRHWSETFLAGEDVDEAHRVFAEPDPAARRGHVLRMQTSDGRSAWIEWQSERVRRPEDDADWVFAVGRQIMEGSDTGRLVDADEGTFRGLFETSQDGIVRTDMAGQILDCNDAYARMLGYSPEELLGRTYRDLTPDAWHRMEAEIVQGQIEMRGYSDEYEKEYIRKDGTTFPIAIRVWLVRDRLGAPHGMWRMVRDITTWKDIEERLRYDATHDALTGVLGPRRIREEVSRSVAEAGRYGHPLSICMADIDSFKSINDGHGHAAGDAVLSRFGSIIRGVLRNVDIAGRWGGDEFLIIFPHTSAPRAAIPAERLRKGIHECVFAGDSGGRFEVTCSFGLADMVGKGTSATDLLAAADQSLYRAKREGRDRVALFGDGGS